jgi:hypothetical protein
MALKPFRFFFVDIFYSTLSPCCLTKEHRADTLKLSNPEDAIRPEIFLNEGRQRQ